MKEERILFRAYWEWGKRCYKKNLVYRADYLFGVLNTVLLILVQIAIWKAVYGSRVTIGDVSLPSLLTYYMLSLCIRNVFAMDEYIMPEKVQTGAIAMDLLRPLNIRGMLLAHNIGDMVFRLFFQFAPALLIVIFTIGPGKLSGPVSVLSLTFFTVSLVCGFMVLYQINFIIAVSAFWFYNNWSLYTIKNALLNIFSGVLFPLWFMPNAIKNVIRFTPFDTIYFIPINVYLGKIKSADFGLACAKQVFWIVLLYVLGLLLWRAATKKLVVQGG